MTSSFYDYPRRRSRNLALLLPVALLACGRDAASSSEPQSDAESPFALTAAQTQLRGWEPPPDGDWIPRWIQHLEFGSRDGQRHALQQLRLAGPAAGPALASALRAISASPDRFGLAVNLVSALGACGATAEWEVLADLLLHHSVPVVRTTAGEAAAQLRPPELLPALRACLAQETEPAPRRAALSAIARIGGEEAVLDLEERVRGGLLASGNRAQTAGAEGADAWNALMLIEGPDLIPALVRLDGLLPPPLRVQALTARLELGDREVGPDLRTYLDPAVYPSAQTRLLALTALAELGDWESLVLAAQDSDPRVAPAIARMFGTPEAVAAGVGVDLLDGWLASDNPELAQAALASLVAHGQRYRLDPWLLLVREFPFRTGSAEALLLLTREGLLDPRLAGVLIQCWPQAAGEHRLDLMRALTKTASPEGAALISRAMLDSKEDPEVRRLAATLLANFPSCVDPLQAWYAQEPGSARAADLVAGLGRHADEPAARKALLDLAGDERAPDGARKIVLDALPRLYEAEGCALLQDLRNRTRRPEVLAYLNFLLASWY